MGMPHVEYLRVNEGKRRSCIHAPPSRIPVAVYRTRPAKSSDCVSPRPAKSSDCVSPRPAKSSDCVSPRPAKSSDRVSPVPRKLNQIMPRTQVWAKIAFYHHYHKLLIEYQVRQI